MHYYKVEAEHVRRIDIGAVADQMQRLQGVEVVARGRDPVFDSNAVWIVVSEHGLGNKLQDIVWEYNSGAWCNQIELSEHEFEDYC